MFGIIESLTRKCILFPFEKMLLKFNVFGSFQIALVTEIFEMPRMKLYYYWINLVALAIYCFMETKLDSRVAKH